MQKWNNSETYLKGYKMESERIEEIAKTYIHGNISDAKKAVKRMTKAEFIDFAEFMRGYYGKELYQLRNLVN